MADNKSTDKTLEVAREYTEKIIEFKGNDFAGLRNKAMEKATGDWVFYVDADERVLKPLRDEVKEIIQGNDKSAFAVSRKNVIFGQIVDYGPYEHDWMIRLFKKSDFETWVGKVHEYGQFKGELGYTKNSFLHLTHRNLDQIVLKSLDWSKIDAKLRFESKHPPMSGLRLLRILATELFNQGIKRKGFFAGTIGTADALLQTFSMVMTYIRLWEMQQPKPLEDIYKEIDEQLIKDGFESR